MNKLRLVAAVVISAAAVFAQETGGPIGISVGHRGPATEAGEAVRYLSHPRVPLSDVDQDVAVTANATTRTASAYSSIPTWQNTVGSYTYQMVGNSPYVAQASPTTTIGAPVVPIIFVFADGTTFDPTAPTTCSSQSATSLTMSSPIFNNFNYAPGGTSVGNTQYADFYQRANFWKYTNPAGINPNYHLLLQGSLTAAVVVNVPAASGNVVSAPCGLRGQVDLNWFDPYLQNTIFPAVASSVNTAQFPIFLFSNVVLYQGTTTSCCILGYHSAFNSLTYSGTLQTYAVADFDTTGSFGTVADVEPLSHEVIEWMDDPLGNNQAPSWGNVGQVTGCSTVLEVGDPLSGTDIVMTGTNAYNYHLQEIAFVSWFYKDSPSIAVNGWYSSNNTFTSPSKACTTTTVSLTINPTSIAVGSAATVSVKVSASGSTLVPTGLVSITTSQSTTALAALTLSSGAASGSVAFPAGSYNVYANYQGDANFSAASSAPVAITVGSPAVTLTPTSLTFASTTVGTSATNQVVTMQNTGTATLTSIKVTLGGASPADFSQSNNCGTSLAVGASCTFTVGFKPTATGTRTASISIADNATNSPQTITLSGTGASAPTAAKSTLSTTALTFASTVVGTTSAAQTVTLTNGGTASLTGIAISLGGTNATSYVLSSNTCTSSLAAGAKCTFSVSFKPTAAGTLTGVVNVLTALSATPQTVSLTGTAVNGTPVVKLSATSLAFSMVTVNTTSTKAVTLTNSGTGPMTISGITVGGTNAASFTQTNTCGTGLAVNASCTISVTFKPTAKVSYAATLSIATNAATTASTVSLSGTGK